MKRFRPSPRWLLLPGFFLIAGWMCWMVSAKFRGRLAAIWDLRAGRNEILTYGLPVDSREEYAQILRSRYGIELNVVAGCVVSAGLIDYVEGYNKVSGGLAKARFGQGVFEEAAREAEARHRENAE